jgi:hypothetical protein
LGECLLQSVDDEGTAVFGHDVHVEPALSAHQLVASDVVDESGAIGSFSPRDHQRRGRSSARPIPCRGTRRFAVGDVDLGARPWKSLVDDEQSQPGLLRGLCTAVHQIERDGAAGPATCPAIAIAK